MASQVAIRIRRSAAQRHALARVEREIRATDPHLRRKYLREFADAYRSYEAVLANEQLDAALLASDLVLVGDYHALPASQQFAADIVERIAVGGRPVVLALEMVFARDQRILDAWMRGEITEDELRARIRFDLDWGYDWAPYGGLLARARNVAQAICGLDCMPRGDLRRIAARDRHAAVKLAEIRERWPDATVVALFGESHLAPTHLPLETHLRLPQARVLTLLQNVDALYWRAAGEPRECVEGVRVAPDVICVFNSTPLEKYESYRLCLERWRQERACATDLGPTYYNLISALLRFLNIDPYALRGERQPQCLVDELPEVHARWRSPQRAKAGLGGDPDSHDALRRALEREAVPEAEIRAHLERLEAAGVCYVPQLNAIVAERFQLLEGAEEAAHFVHHACRGEWMEPMAAPAAAPRAYEDEFYARVMEEALRCFGSLVLNPGRRVLRESELYALYAQPREAIEEQTLFRYREYMQMLDFLVLHKDYEANVRAYWELPELMCEGVAYLDARREFCTRVLGQLLGAEIYDAYLAGRAPKRFLRTLFCRKLLLPGAARLEYFTTVRRLRAPRRRKLAA
jgi:hypothetical protein